MDSVLTKSSGVKLHNVNLVLLCSTVLLFYNLLCWCCRHVGDVCF